MKRSAIAVLAALGAACGLIDGLKGPQSEPAAAPLSSLHWHGPVQIDQGVSVASDAPRLAWGQNAAWVAYAAYDRATNTDSVWVTRRPRGGTFARPVPLPAAAGWDGGAAYPQIAAGDTGGAVVVASEWVLDSSSIVTASSIWGGRVNSDLAFPSGISRIDSAQTTAGSLTQRHAIAADADGNAMVVFPQMSGLYAASEPAAGSWTSLTPVDSTAGSSWCDVAAGSGGNALVGWLQQPGDGTSPPTVYAMTLSLSSNAPLAGTPKYLNNLAGADLAVAMRDDQGHVVTASASGGMNTFPVSGGFWGIEQVIPDTNLAYNVDPALAVSSNGDAVLVWRDISPTNSNQYAGTLQASFWDGISWSPKQQISQNNPNPHAWWAQVDINDHGEAVAAWADFDSTGTYTRIFANVLDTSSGTPVWSGPVAIDHASPDAGLAGTPENVRYVGVALERDGGSAQVIWMQHEGDANATPRTWANWIE